MKQVEKLNNMRKVYDVILRQIAACKARIEQDVTKKTLA
jgi:hypothetical protein